MSTRDHAPLGAPCWADLSTPDVEGSRRFYGELLGWEANEPSPEFGGYFMFTRDGVPVAGGMGPSDDVPARNAWNIYLATDDIAKALELTEKEGGQVLFPAMPVADLGIQAVVLDPAGATVGLWQAGTFPGFTVLNEPGAPSWCELHTRSHSQAVEFYRRVFRWDTNVTGDSDEFRYTTMRDPEGDGELAGIMDAAAWLPEGTPSHWSIYWEVEDTAATVARVKALGGDVVMDCEETPYGQLAAVTDPAGALFKLRTSPA